MDILEHARRRAFSLWLRTGRLPRWAKSAASEVKYNPWHDPDDGRFTFKERGRYFGRGSSGRAEARMHERPSNRGRRTEPFGGFSPDENGDLGWNGGGASIRWTTHEEDARSVRDNTTLAQRNANRSPQDRVHAYARAYRQTVDNPRNWRRVEANGYLYLIDTEGRTRRVAGRLTENVAHRRSRSAQARAGGPDRRRSDDGGHYIARRFNGPTEAFNHFAQDANFNRGAYLQLENQWSRAMRAGQRVDVMIEPVYRGSSQRPSAVRVTFWMDGVKRRMRFPNEPRERTRARR